MTMTEEAAVTKAMEIIDALFEEAEAAVLRLDVNQKSFEYDGKFANNMKKKDGMLVVNRNVHSESSLPLSPPLSSSSKTLISSGATSPSSSPSTSLTTTTNSDTSFGYERSREHRMETSRGKREEKKLLRARSNNSTSPSSHSDNNNGGRL